MEEVVKFNHELLLDLDVTQNLNQFFFSNKDRCYTEECLIHISKLHISVGFFIPPHRYYKQSKKYVKEIK